MKAQQIPQELGHVLTEKDVSCIASWKQWKERWEEESCVEILHSLLHFGFSVTVDGYDEDAERVCMYLNIADKGDSFLRVFQRSDDKDLHFYNTFGREVRTTEDLRKVLSQKAFQMLCQNFFKNTSEKDYYLPSWMPLAAHPQVFTKLFWFFRLNELWGMPNLHLRYSGNHNEEIAADFALNFCLSAWDCDEEYGNRYYKVSEEVRERLKQSQPDMITILFGLRKLDVLLRRDICENIDKECIKKLQELTLESELNLPDIGSCVGRRRKPQSIEEACLGRSQAAQVLIVLQVIQSEKERFDEMRRLEEQRREAEEKLNKLKK